jgi:serine/threonine protein kinase
MRIFSPTSPTSPTSRVATPKAGMCDTSFVFTGKLGRGSGGAVFCARTNGEVEGVPPKVAVKRVRVGRGRTRSQTAEAQEFALEEVEALEALGKHCNVMGYFAHFWSPDDVLSIVCELCEGDLERYMELRGQGSTLTGDWFGAPTECKCLSGADVFDILRGVAGGLEYIHSKGLVHHDIKPSNVLMMGKVPKIADFGLSRAGGALEEIREVYAASPKALSPL